MSLVKKANRISSEELSCLVESEAKSSKACSGLRVVRSKELKDADRSAIWAMFEQNMRNFYMNSSFGWDPEEKKAELFHPQSRFILIYEQPGCNDVTDGAESDRAIGAYAMFRFDDEDEQDVVYCYELQVSSSLQRSGLGRLLVQIMESIGRHCRMTKVVLTLFKSNTAAHAFYTAIGFTPDSTSPEQPQFLGENGSEMEKCDYDYTILSRCIE